MHKYLLNYKKQRYALFLILYKKKRGFNLYLLFEALDTHAIK